METIQEESEENTFKARPYQDQILQICLEKNTIVYLPTGSGKTFIALMAMRHLAKDADLPLSEGGRRIVFLVNTVVLAHQQAKCIEKATNFRTAVYTGDMNVDAWRRDKWSSEFEENQILVATCQIILDVIRHGFISMKHLSLIVFDECHHGRRSHPMHQLMEHYHKCAERERPRVIGLTGMLISGTVEPQSVVTDLESLENTFHATIATVGTIKDYTNVLIYSTNPKEQLKLYQAMQKTAFIQRIEKIVENLIERVKQYPIDETHRKAAANKLNNKVPSVYKSMQTILRDFLYQLNDSGIYGASIAILSVIVDLELKKRSSDTDVLRKLVRELITGAEYIRHMLIEEMEEEDDDDEAVILTNGSPKLINLIYFLRTYFMENSAADVKGLIFVQRRYTAKCIYHIINKFAEKCGQDRFPVKCDFMVGNNSNIPESIEQILENKWNRRVLERFMRNETNLIIATSVLEEGVDLQMCNLVISYDVPSSFRSYVQSKGRARKRDSTYMIMCPSNDRLKVEQSLVKYQKIDKILKDYLVGKTIDRAPPLEKDIDNEFANSFITPFKTKAGATLEALSAVSLLNRYCQTLPTDQYTVITIIWRKIVIDKKFIVSVRLPMQSTVRDEIASIPASSIKLAKYSAAFKACVELYYKGELNENLMPINAKRCISMYREVYLKYWNADESRLAGTKKQIRSHPIQFPGAVTKTLPQLYQQTYLYPIQIEPGFIVNNDNKNNLNDQILYNLYKSSNTFGILLSKPIPKLGLMKFYVTLGLIRVKIATKPIMITLTDAEQLNGLRKFHNMIFTDVLETVRTFLASDYDNEENSFFIVPINETGILWPIVEQFPELPRFGGTVETKSVYRAEDYLHKVVWPIYRTDQTQRYVVTKVHEHLTPNSPFPNANYASYAAYVHEKYKGMAVKNNNQFLIEVRGITTRFNMLTPGEGKEGSKGFSANRGPELLIPELCHNFQMPADLWLKATLLPSILHRFHYLLIAENIRQEIIRFIGLPADENYEPEPVMDQMKRTQIRDPDEIAQIPALIYPNLDNDLPVEVRQKEVAKEKMPWLEIHEPMDLERNLPKAYSFDLDYYYNFVNKKLQDMKINDSIGDEIVRNIYGSSALNHQNRLAICDVPESERFRINLLDINLQTQTKGPLQSELLAAITTACANDIFDMERFELLGDSFLKFSVSLFLLNNHPTWHEGHLTMFKGQIVSNRNLFYIGKQRNIGGLLNIRPLNPKNDWRPPLMTVPRNIQSYISEGNVFASSLDRLHLTREEFQCGTVSKDSLYNFVAQFIQESEQEQRDTSLLQNFLLKQSVPDKVVADCVEAIIGCCVKSMGIERTFGILQMFEILPKSNNNYETLLMQRNFNPRLHTMIGNRDIDSLLLNYQKIQDVLGYKFNDRAYLLQALTHPSFPTNQLTGCYQQMEFLGDAVLDVLISAYIFEHCTEMDPGQLTDLRSALVNNVTLACICVRYNIHVHILSQNAVLSEQIATFVKNQLDHGHQVGDHVQLLFEESDIKMGECVDIPKLLGDIVESLIGAVFLDSGYNLQVTWRVIYRLLHNEIQKFMVDTPIQLVRRLEEFKGANPKFDDPVVEDDVVMVTVRFTCKGQLCQVHGFGTNKENAKKGAAKVALRKLTE